MVSAIAPIAGLQACATGKILDSDGGPTDAGGQDASIEVSILPLDGAVLDVFDAGCAKDASLGGVGVPAGSTASATTSYSTSTPNLAIDGDTTTYWNAGATTGSLTVTFPSATTFDGVHLECAALPASSETFTITGYQSGTPAQIGTSTQTVAQGVSALAPISVTAGAYDAIKIDVTSSQSWVAIAEVSLLTTYCP